MPSPALLETLRRAQRLGFFGAGPIEEAIAHAAQFADALADLPPAGRVLDLGSGGGLPGLVIATRLPGVRLVLLDRREKRTDFLERAVLRLDLEHVEVWRRDASEVVREVATGEVAGFDAVTARGFGPPEHTLRIARGCLTDHGRIVISEPPSGDRWAPELLRELGLSARLVGGVRIFSADHTH